MPNFSSDGGSFVGRFTYEAVQIYGAGGDLEAEVVKVCLGMLDHCGFHYQYILGRFGEISPRQPLS